MTALSSTSLGKPFRHFPAAAATLAILAALAALSAIWTWSVTATDAGPRVLGLPGSSAARLPRSSGREIAVSEIFSRVDLPLHDTDDAELAGMLDNWWPQNVSAAARMFHCTPSASQDTHQSVVVWTDAKNMVLAYAGAVAGRRPPLYAIGLADANALEEIRLAYPATSGIRVIAARRTYALQIGQTRLGCAATAND